MYTHTNKHTYTHTHTVSSIYVKNIAIIKCKKKKKKLARNRPYTLKAQQINTTPIRDEEGKYHLEKCSSWFPLAV